MFYIIQLKREFEVKENFFALAERYFSIEEVTAEEYHPEYSSDDIKIVKMVLLASEENVQN